MSVVLDASALLALLRGEAGSGQVASAIEGACMCTVNWAEVVGRAVVHGADPDLLEREMLALGLSFEAFTSSMASTAGKLRPLTRPHGLSLGDCACLALALDKRLPVLTANRIWRELQLDLDVRLVR